MIRWGRDSQNLGAIAQYFQARVPPSASNGRQTDRNLGATYTCGGKVDRKERVALPQPFSQVPSYLRSKKTSTRGFWGIKDLNISVTCKYLFCLDKHYGLINAMPSLTLSMSLSLTLKWTLSTRPASPSLPLPLPLPGCLVSRGASGTSPALIRTPSFATRSWFTRMPVMATRRGRTRLLLYSEQNC